MKFTKKLALGVTVMMAVVAVGCGGGGEKKAAVKYPTKPINLIVPYAAGGSSDLSARPFANELHNILKQPVVVVNKPGAGGRCWRFRSCESQRRLYTFECFYR
jgi:tripartite-type tricarboxylate transporter receptor subunit TctC